MAPKNYYELLGIAPAASADEVKRAFRQQIARYHPDKVQHLGKEFQEMAADRAAELTEAYRILSSVELREQYDRSRDAGAPPQAAPPPAAAPSTPSTPAAPAAPGAGESPRPSEAGTQAPANQFSHERATKDEFVRKATIGRFRQALTATVGNSYDEATVKGFDVACVPKSKLFARKKGPRLLVRFVARVDGESVLETWTQAGKWPGTDEICVFLIGPAVASPRELAETINDQRRKGARGAKVTLIPVDSRDWQAHIPVDAPAVARSLLTRVRTGA